MKLRNLKSGLLILASLFTNPSLADNTNSEENNSKSIAEMIEVSPSSYFLSDKIGEEKCSIDYKNSGDKVVIRIERKSGSMINYASYRIVLTDIVSEDEEFGSIDRISFSFIDKRAKIKIGEDEVKNTISISTEYNSTVKPFSRELIHSSQEAYLAILEYISSRSIKLSKDEIENIDSFYRDQFHKGGEALFQQFYANKGNGLQKFDDALRKASKKVRDFNATRR